MKVLFQSEALVELIEEAARQHNTTPEQMAQDAALWGLLSLNFKRSLKFDFTLLGRAIQEHTYERVSETMRANANIRA